MKWQLGKVANRRYVLRLRLSPYGPSVLVAAALSATVMALMGGPLSASVSAAEVELSKSKLTAATTGAEAEEGAGAFGRSVALSADGETALVGGPGDAEGRGAAWVFVREAGVWEQVAKLTAGGAEVGAGRFGRGVALSADGETALVGAPGDRADAGSVWVFQRTETGWTEQARLVASGERGVGHFGRGLALSGDGNTALVGAPGEDERGGGVWAFTRTGGTWTAGERLTPADASAQARFGGAVALSFDGSSALIGGASDGEGAGGAWIFQRGGPGGGSWAQQGGELTGAGEQGEGEFGSAVALSPDGSTALVGGPHDDEGDGAVWVFARSGSSWNPQGGKILSEIGGREHDFGSSVALSGNGERALIGAAAARGREGGAWMWERVGGSWSRLGFFLTGQERLGEQFGSSVAIAAEDETSLIGALGSEAETDAGQVGSAWVFTGKPTLTEPPNEEPPHEKEEEEEEHNNSTPGGSPPGGTPPGGGSGQAKVEVLAVSEARRTGAKACGVGLVSRRLAVDGKGRVAVKLRTTGSGRCAGRVTLSLAHRVRGASAKKATIHNVAIGAVRFSLAGGHRGTVRLKLTHTGRSLLGTGHGMLTVSLRLLRSAPAPAQARSAKARLVLQKPKRVEPKP